MLLWLWLWFWLLWLLLSSPLGRGGFPRPAGPAPGTDYPGSTQHGAYQPVPSVF